MRPTSIKLLIASAAAALLPFSSAIAQDAEAAPEATSTSLLGLLQQGGWAMYPLGLTALFMFFLIFYCWRETRPGRFVPSALVGVLEEKLGARAVDDARSLCAGTSSVLHAASPMRSAKPGRTSLMRTRRKWRVVSSTVSRLKTARSGNGSTTSTSSLRLPR